MSDGGTAVISTADMDGSNVRHIITENIVFPNGLAISYYGNKYMSVTKLRARYLSLYLTYDLKSRHRWRLLL